MGLRRLIVGLCAAAAVMAPGSAVAGQGAPPTATLAIVLSPNPLPFRQVGAVTVDGTATAAGYLNVVEVDAGATCEASERLSSVGSAFVGPGAFGSVFEFAASTRSGTLCASFAANERSDVVIARASVPFTVDVGGAIVIDSVVAGLDRFAITGHVDGAGQDRGRVSPYPDECDVTARGDEFRVVCLFSPPEWCLPDGDSEHITLRQLQACETKRRTRELRLSTTLASGAGVEQLVEVDVGPALDAYRLVEPQLGLGGVRLGMTREELERLAAGPLRRPSGERLRRFGGVAAYEWGKPVYEIGDVMFWLDPNGAVDAMTTTGYASLRAGGIALRVRIGSHELGFFRFKPIVAASRGTELRCVRTFSGKVEGRRIGPKLRCVGSRTLIAASTLGGVSATVYVATPARLRPLRKWV